MQEDSLPTDLSGKPKLYVMIEKSKSFWIIVFKEIRDDMIVSIKTEQGKQVGIIRLSNNIHRLFFMKFLINYMEHCDKEFLIDMFLFLRK